MILKKFKSRICIYTFSIIVERVQTPKYPHSSTYNVQNHIHDFITTTQCNLKKQFLRLMQPFRTDDFPVNSDAWKKFFLKSSLHEEIRVRGNFFSSVSITRRETRIIHIRLKYGINRAEILSIIFFFYVGYYCYCSFFPFCFNDKQLHHCLHPFTSHVNSHIGKIK